MADGPVGNLKKVAIIPARGGSKRLPNKNIIDFMGKPLIAHTIEAALKSDLFDRVMVSTDSEVIAKIAREYGATVPFLRDQYAGEHATVSEAIVYSLQQLFEKKQEKYDLVFQLMPNCPLRDANDLIHAYQHFMEHKLAFQISVFEYGWMNPWWAISVSGGQPHMLFAEALKKRSQDLEKLYCPTGAIWVAKTIDLLRHKNFYGPGYGICVLDWQSAVDIDEAADLEMAKAVYLLKHGKI